MAYIVMAYIAMAHIDGAYIVMAYTHALLEMDAMYEQAGLQLWPIADAKLWPI